MQKKYNRFKEIKNYNYKKEKRKKKEKERKKKENCTELQKPNVEAEVYDNNKNCD